MSDAAIMDIVGLSAPVASWDQGALTIRCVMDGMTELWVTHYGPRSILQRVKPRIEPFLPMALLVAGAAGVHLDVAGPVDQTYLTTLRLGYLPLVRSLFGFPPIELRATVPRGPTRGWTIRRRPAPEPAALLFSGGVDSMYSFIRLRRAGHTLRTLININAGAYGDDMDLMWRRFRRVQDFAAAHDVEAVLVDTNFHEAVRIAHDMSYTIRNISAAGTLFRAIAGVVESTSRSYYQIDPARLPRYIGNIAPTLTVSFAWTGMPLIEVGYETSRFDKLLTVTEMPESRTALDVCVNGAYQLASAANDPMNCGRCSKCAWVLIALEKMGRLEQYRAVFDLEHFRAEHDAAVAAIEERRILEFVSPIEPSPAREPIVRIEPPKRAGR